MISPDLFGFFIKAKVNLHSPRENETVHHKRFYIVTMCLSSKHLKGLIE